MVQIGHGDQVFMMRQQSLQSPSCNILAKLQLVLQAYMRGAASLASRTKQSSADPFLLVSGLQAEQLLLGSLMQLLQVGEAGLGL